MVLKTFWSQNRFSLLKIIEDPKNFCLCVLHLLIVTVLKCKLVKLLRDKDTQVQISLAVRPIASSHGITLYYILWKTIVYLWANGDKKANNVLELLSK